LVLQNRELAEELEQISRSYQKIDAELQKMLKKPQPMKVDEAALKSLEIERLQESIAQIKASKEKMEEHYLSKVEELTV